MSSLSRRIADRRNISFLAEAALRIAIQRNLSRVRNLGSVCQRMRECSRSRRAERSAGQLSRHENRQIPATPFGETQVQLDHARPGRDRLAPALLCLAAQSSQAAEVVLPDQTRLL